MNSLSSSKTAVKDSFEDDEGSDDVEDEVFIRDGRNGYKIDDEMGVKRPLMAPRRKCRPFNHVQHGISKKKTCIKCCAKFYRILTFSVLVGFIIMLVVALQNDFLSSVRGFVFWPVRFNSSEKTYVPGINFDHKILWMQSFPKFKSETSITLAKLNSDDIEDIVIGYSTGGETIRNCPEGRGCGGGAYALDGQSGSVLWQFWTRSDVYFVDCSANINNEPTPDCLLSGKGGVLCVVDGKTGQLIWEVSSNVTPDSVNDYSAQFIFNVDEDNIPDILISHSVYNTGYIAIMNGRKGDILGKIETPDKGGLFTVPRITVSEDGTYGIVFATGSQSTPGSLYYIPVYGLLSAVSAKCHKIWSNSIGVSSGIILADMNLDKIEDIIITSKNKLMIFSGKDFKQIWNVSLNENSPSEILSGPTPAYFDDDNIPDLLVTVHVGAYYGAYFYSETQVFSGADGSQLLDEGIISAGAITSPGIAVSFGGTGNDMYLYWLAHCGVSKEKQMHPFSFPEDVPIDMEVNADLCKLRFNTSMVTKLYMLSEHIRPPGVPIYSSDEHWYDEHKLTGREEPIVTSTQSVIRSSFKNKNKFPASQTTFSNTDDNDAEEPTYLQRESSIDLSRYEPMPADPDFIPLDIKTEGDGGSDSIEYEALEGDGPLRVEPQYGGIYERDERVNFNPRRKKRSIAQQTSELPRALATPTLAAPLGGKGVDIIFATHWTSSSNAQILTQDHKNCIEKVASDQSVETYNNPTEYEMMRKRAERECIGEIPPSVPITLGQLTIYRANVAASCSHIESSQQQCSQPIPRQSYPRRTTDIYFRSRENFS